MSSDDVLTTLVQMGEQAFAEETRKQTEELDRKFREQRELGECYLRQLAAIVPGIEPYLKYKGFFHGQDMVASISVPGWAEVRVLGTVYLNLLGPDYRIHDDTVQILGLSVGLLQPVIRADEMGDEPWMVVEEIGEYVQTRIRDEFIKVIAKCLYKAQMMGDNTVRVRIECAQLNQAALTKQAVEEKEKQLNQDQDRFVRWDGMIKNIALTQDLPDYPLVMMRLVLDIACSLSDLRDGIDGVLESIRGIE